MLRLIVTAHLVIASLLTRLASARKTLTHQDDRDERGSVSLEQVIIALALFLVATAVVAGITAAVNSRLSRIN